MESESSSNSNGATDPFELVSGFYGPGALAAWYLSIGSVVLPWLLDPDAEIRLTSEFLVALLYPIIAIGHLIIQVANFPSGMEAYLAVNLMNNLRRNYEGPVSPDNEGFGKAKPDTSLSEHSQVYAQILSINSASTVSHVCGSLIFWVVMMNSLRLAISVTVPRKWHPGKVAIALFTVFAWHLVGSLMMMSRLWNQPHGWHMFPFQSFAARVLFWHMILAMPLYMQDEIGLLLTARWEKTGAAGVWVPSVPRRTVVDLASKIVMFGSFYVLQVCAWSGHDVDFFPGHLYVPPSGMSISELDQAASLAGGLIVFLLKMRAFL